MPYEMKKLIIILSTRFGVDILGFPIYLELYIEPKFNTHQINDPRPFNNGAKLQHRFVKQY